MRDGPVPIDSHAWSPPSVMLGNPYRRGSFRLFQCPLLAQSGHHDCAEPCPLLGAKRTSNGSAPMSAYDPNRMSKTRCFWIACKPETHLFSTETCSMALL